jgi:chlorite dismutase
MSEAPETLEGSFIWHDFRRLDLDAWDRLGASGREAALEALGRRIRPLEGQQDGRESSFGLYQLAGHKADLLFMHLRPTLADLVALKAELLPEPFFRTHPPVYSYISVVELSRYVARGNPDPTTNPALRERLYPSLPETAYVCFYPMSKRRSGEDNWYTLSRDERAHMMRGHGAIGHRYHERVTQIISGSQGLDDWEWGVTLYADDAIDFKKLVYEMRFDEASARFADFGPFYVGRRIGFDELSSWLLGSAPDAR